MENCETIDVDVDEATKNNDTRNDVGRVKSADVWKYFDHGKEKGTAVCKMCKSVLKATGGSTSGLINHAKTKHEVEVNVLKRKLHTAGWFPYCCTVNYMSYRFVLVQCVNLSLLN